MEWWQIVLIILGIIVLLIVIIKVGTLRNKKGNSSPSGSLRDSALNRAKKIGACCSRLFKGGA